MILTSIITSIAMIYQLHVYGFNTRIQVHILFFSVAMHIFFTAEDLIMLGIGFEMQSVALLGLLLVPQDEDSPKIQYVKASSHAAYMLLCYSLISGCFYAYGAVRVFTTCGTLDTHLLWMCKKYWTDEMIISFFIAGSIKCALAPFHIWLGKVHTEASTVGSVLLAALSLKTGYYLHMFLVPEAPRFMHILYPGLTLFI